MDNFKGLNVNFLGLLQSPMFTLSNNNSNRPSTTSNTSSQVSVPASALANLGNMSLLTYAPLLNSVNMNNDIDLLSYQLLLQNFQLPQFGANSFQNGGQIRGIGAFNGVNMSLSGTKRSAESVCSSNSVSTDNSRCATLASKYLKTEEGKKQRRRRTCTKEGCEKLAQGRSTLCFAHGGGYRCEHPGCESGARGCTSFCIKHGGGLRCSFPGCKSSARGKARLCISHGGGKRCNKDGCDKAAQGATDFCKRHLKDNTN